jgi:hypothetical protein
VADEIHLWKMIFIHGRRFEKLIFQAYGMSFWALLVSANLVSQIKKKLNISAKTESQFGLLSSSMNEFRLI